MSIRTFADLVPASQRVTVKRYASLPLRRDLDRLARWYGTDKSTRHHGYAPLYQRHLPPRRQVRALLEIGIGGTTSFAGYETTTGGQSLRMWQDYYPRAQIVGLDLYEKAVPGPRIVTVQGSQDDPAFLADVARRYGPFDVIIDDGSHIGRHIATSFDALFVEHLRPGGIYAVEDLETAYRPDYEGGAPGQPGTAAVIVKDLVDSVQRRHWSGDDALPVAALHVYDQVAFIQRA